MRRRRFKNKSNEVSAALPVSPAGSVADHVFEADAPKALFEGDVASQRLFNRAALSEMGDYSAVILASDSLRPAWSEPGDLVHVRRGAEDAASITDKVKQNKQR